jgi:hypothetical protein
MTDMDDEAMEKILSNLSELRNTILASFVPEEAKQHFLSSRREAYLGMKAILQHAIDRCDEHVSGDTHQEKNPSHSIEISE